ncbi:serine protease 40-like [Colias croceus]|uniref:serine protease 40-like n=1 Tax=Colias crocea TaxID=72248 RepID=UPI001E27CA11|nr:serine protease 40-like [Colias croceus]
MFCAFGRDSSRYFYRMIIVAVVCSIDLRTLSSRSKTTCQTGPSPGRTSTFRSGAEIQRTSGRRKPEPSGRRIYKGERTKIKYFPFMASVHIFNSFHCAGSIIKSDLIITASSCLQLAYNNRLFRENPAFLSVRVGSSFYSGGGEVISVLEVYFHPGYDPKTLRNNLCILRLSRHLKFSRKVKRVKRIDFDRNPWNLPLTTPGVTILGWGAKGRSGIIFDPWKNILSFAMLDIYPRQDCQDVYTKEFVTNKHFCAGFLSKGGGACNRDVGGPGVVDGKLMGVVSFGSPTCGTPDAPTVFTKLGYYTDWIEDIMEKPVPSSLKRTTPESDFDLLKAMIPTKPPKPTTFKIEPFTGKTMKPMSIFEIDKALRMLDDDLFREFLSTMFDSKEIREYQNNLREEKKETTTEKQVEIEKQNEIKKETSEESIEAVEFVTKMPELEDNEFTTMAMDSENSESKEPVESDIVKFMKNVDLKKIIQEEVNVTPRVTIERDTKEKNESVVTFLYLSDDEKNRNTDIVDDEEGLSIPDVDDKFEDMTRAKGKETQYRILPENELYGLLSDVIETEVKNKMMKGVN